MVVTITNLISFILIPNTATILHQIIVLYQCIKSDLWNNIQGYLKGYIYFGMYWNSTQEIWCIEGYTSRLFHLSSNTRSILVTVYIRRKVRHYSAFVRKKIYICNAWYKWRQTLSNGIVSHCLNIHLLHSVIPNFLRIRRTKRRRNL